MKLFFLLLFIVYIHLSSETINYEEVIIDLRTLEKYIKQYIKEKDPSLNLTHLITCYIRLGGYSEFEWSIAGGIIPDDLPQYILDKDKSKGTSAHLCQTYRDMDLPNNEKLDFVHFFAVMNGIENGNSYSDAVAHLVGWGGDVFQLLQDIKNEKGTLGELKNIAKNYFLIKGGLDFADFISDLDAPILLKKKNDNIDFADIIEEYYKGNEYFNRIKTFVELTFPSITDKTQFRDKIFEVYDNDPFIRILECQDGMRTGYGNCLFAGDIKPEYIKNQKAAVYVFSDYLQENY